MSAGHFFLFILNVVISEHCLSSWWCKHARNEMTEVQCSNLFQNALKRDIRGRCTRVIYLHDLHFCTSQQHIFSDGYLDFLFSILRDSRKFAVCTKKWNKWGVKKIEHLPSFPLLQYFFLFSFVTSLYKMFEGKFLVQSRMGVGTISIFAVLLLSFWHIPIESYRSIFTTNQLCHTYNADTLITWVGCGHFPFHCLEMKFANFTHILRDYTLSWCLNFAKLDKLYVRRS